MRGVASAGSFVGDGNGGVWVDPARGRGEGASCASEKDWLFVHYIGVLRMDLSLEYPVFVEIVVSMCNYVSKFLSNGGGGG